MHDTNANIIKLSCLIASLAWKLGGLLHPKVLWEKIPGSRVESQENEVFQKDVTRNHKEMSHSHKKMSDRPKKKVSKEKKGKQKPRTNKFGEETIFSLLFLSDQVCDQPGKTF